MATVDLAERGHVVRVPVHQLMVALPLTLVGALGIGIVVQGIGRESTDLLTSSRTEPAAVRDPITMTAPGLAELVAPQPEVAPGIGGGPDVSGLAMRSP